MISEFILGPTLGAVGATRADRFPPIGRSPRQLVQGRWHRDLTLYSIISLAAAQLAAVPHRIGFALYSGARTSSVRNQLTVTFAPDDLRH